MCSVCNIKTSTVVGAVVKNVRRCSKRPAGDHGAGLAYKQSLFNVTKIASRGEGVYGHLINQTTFKLRNISSY
jgi:hypothetical protein